MDRRAREIYAEKKEALEKGDAEVTKQVGRGKDILSILMRANSSADVNDRLPEEEVIAQMSVFLAAAQDTTSNAIARVLHILAQKPDYQERLRNELLESRAGDDLAYDDLNRLPLLDSIIRETLRLYPPASILLRVATQDTVLPLSEPIRTVDGQEMTEVPIPKGSEFLVGFLGCNASRSVWGEDSLEWRPKRWMPSLPTSVTEARIPGVYPNLTTFAAGKRSCIGFKFAEMEMKAMLSMLISHFVFQLSDKPIVWNVAAILYPTVGWESLRPELPLSVGLYK
ncbi:cytochrome P450 [Fomitopsis serialis]|uniref:cytochrome P450 n=1 Tax=Fomitopsis serialis TaxID=139415 RepID=UPI0020081C6B|nr:cytochrome P450 [Neoantrodia serialis]KAH9913843.1 cytochrome P450 [Neoantrodia serialis]